MAKARRRRVRDTWKDKQWYKITTPKEFGESEIGTTPARDPNLLLRRKVEATMRELVGTSVSSTSSYDFRYTMWLETLLIPGTWDTK